MKRKISLVGFILCVALLTSCIGSGSEESVAKKYIEGVATLSYDKMDSVSIIPYERIFDEMVRSSVENYGITTEEFYERISKAYDFEKEVKNFDDYKKEYEKYIDKRFKEQYGDDYSIDISIINISDLSDEDKSQMLAEASDMYDKQGIVISDVADFAKIKKAKKVESKVYYNGSKVEENKTEDVTIYLVKVQNQWKVLNIGAK